MIILIEDQILKIKEYFTVKDYEVLVYRLWAVIVGFFLPIYGLCLIYFLPESIERLDHRIAISMMWFSFIGSSYFISFFKKHIPFFSLLGNLVTISWVLWIVVVNNFSPEYSIGLFLTFSCMSVISRDIIELSIFSSFFFIILSISIYLSPIKLINIGIYALSILIVVTVLILNMLRNQYINNQLISLNNRLEHKNQELERFVYVASHDLKSPIRTIGSFASLMQRRLGKERNQDIQEYMDFIMAGVNRMTEIIEDLLDYSQYGFNTITFETVDISQLINEVWLEITGDLENVEIVLSDNMPQEVKVNRNQIKQLFQNLIENGLKYNQSDQKIIRVNYSTSKSFHVFKVEDNGIGIDKKYKKKIFEMFQRLHANDEFGGTGIGLAVCKRIIENHNGYINLKKAASQGSVFELKISKNLK